MPLITLTYLQDQLTFAQGVLDAAISDSGDSAEDTEAAFAVRAARATVNLCQNEFDSFIEADPQIAEAFTSFQANECRVAETAVLVHNRLQELYEIE